MVNRVDGEYPTDGDTGWKASVRGEASGPHDLAAPWQFEPEICWRYFFKGDIDPAAALLRFQLNGRPGGTVAK